MNIVDIILKKKNKMVLTKEEIDYVISGFVSGTIKDYQMSALLMSIVLNGMNEDETIFLTEAMINNSKSLDLSVLGDTVVDKHSTGGVGDKTTLIIAPLVASCGVMVAKMSGRGLGYTGGTIDKLESISGIKVNKSIDEFISTVKNIGFCITSQTEDVALADKKIYSLRDVTGTVESLSLIASSIMSKKIALGVKKLVLDIKVGSGALIKNIESARKLARIMINIGKLYNIKVVCLLTNMDVPLGSNVGNMLEVKEAIDVLKNQKQGYLTDLSIALATQMVSLGLGIDDNKAYALVLNNLKNGNAYRKFMEYINYEGGTIDFVNKDKYVYEITARRDGYLTNLSALDIGKFSMALGSGRINKDDNLDYGAGIELFKKSNDFVKINEPILRFYTNKENINVGNNLFKISSEKEKEYKLIYEIIK